MSGQPKDNAAVADDLADRVNRLAMSRVDPETFHVERNGIAVELRQLAKRLRGDPPRRRIHVYRQPGH